MSFHGPGGRRLGQYKLVVGASAITFTTEFTNVYFGGKLIYRNQHTGGSVYPSAIVTDRAGSVGFSEEELLRAAGFVQHVTDIRRSVGGKGREGRIGRGFFLGSPPFGDYAADQALIRAGFAYYYARREGCQ